MTVLLCLITQSKFCDLNYDRVKKKLNGSQLGLYSLFEVGFVRSADGQHFNWEDTQVNRSTVAFAHEFEQNQKLSGCKHKCVGAQAVSLNLLDYNDAVEEDGFLFNSQPLRAQDDPNVPCGAPAGL